MEVFRSTAGVSRRRKIELSFVVTCKRLCTDKIMPN